MPTESSVTCTQRELTSTENDKDQGKEGVSAQRWTRLYGCCLALGCLSADGAFLKCGSSPTLVERGLFDRVRCDVHQLKAVASAEWNARCWRRCGVEGGVCRVPDADPFEPAERERRDELFVQECVDLDMRFGEDRGAYVSRTITDAQGSTLSTSTRRTIRGEMAGGRPTTCVSLLRPTQVRPRT